MVNVSTSMLEWILVGLVGLCFGSFFNVVIWRLPKQLVSRWRRDATQFLREEGCFVLGVSEQKRVFNLCWPASHCPHCGHFLKPWMNIPVVSWLFLKGRCGFCRSSISVRYPLVEGLTALFAVACVYRFGLSWTALFAFVIISFLLVMALIDWDTQYLPDSLTLSLMWLGLILNYLCGMWTDMGGALWGAVGGYLFFWSVYWGFKLLTGKDGMGGGDFKLLAALGACFGWQALPFIVLLSCFLGILVQTVRSFLQKEVLAKPFAFGPYLAFSGAVVLLAYPRLSSIFFLY
jgi:leader peptidase (prepilin peptidase)/N-methyltransferase